MLSFINYSYIFAALVFTVYGQIILKLRLPKFGPLPSTSWEKLKFLILVLWDPVIFSGFAAAFLASLSWIMAMTKFDLSHAYPFMALNFVMVLLLSVWLFNDPLTIQKILGCGLVVLGIAVAAHG